MKIAIFGAGQIGTAVYRIIKNGNNITNSAFVIDSDKNNLAKIDDQFWMDVNVTSVDDIAAKLIDQNITHVVNAMPFFMNEKIATSALKANASYIDFTEDDIMADKVQAIYEGSNLNCAVKCGLAPGFINYIGYDLVNQIDTPHSLVVSVGALPKNVSFAPLRPEQTYNLSWSVDGLVNEYIRPCRVRLRGQVMEVPACTGVDVVMLDGVQYESSGTSGGIGSLVKDLPHVPNVEYRTLRYPGHFDFVSKLLARHHNDFDKIKAEFLRLFPFTNDDVIVVYAMAKGLDKNGKFIVRTYANKFYGVHGLTGIQSTTAGAGVAILEMMLYGNVKGMIDHSQVNVNQFMNTNTFANYYSTK